MRDKQVVIFDLDGTAIDSPKQQLPSQRLKKAVKALQKGRRLSVATGRPWSYAQPVIDGLGITEPCIIASGTQICDPKSGEVLWQSSLSSASLKGVVKTLKDQERLHPTRCRVFFDDFDEHQHFNGGMTIGELEAPGPAHFISAVFVPDDLAHGVFTQLSAIADINCTLVVAQAPGHKDIHITSNTASKEHAVVRLLEVMGLDSGTTIGIGDGYNDLHLFNAVSHRVAMGNAVDELKSQADRVIGHVEQDGLAEFFEHIGSRGR